MAGLGDLISSLFGGDSAPQASGYVDPNVGFGTAPTGTQGPSFGNQGFYSSPKFTDPNAGGFDIGKIIAAGAPALGGLIGMIKGGQSDKALADLTKTAKAQAGAGNQALTAYTSGQLTPAQQAALDQKKKAELAAYQQYAARAGIPESTAMADFNAKVEQDSLVAQNAMLQQDFDNAMKSMGLSQTGLSDVAKMQLLQDEQQRKVWEEFMASLGKIGTDIGPWIMNLGSP